MARGGVGNWRRLPPPPPLLPPVAPPPAHTLCRTAPCCAALCCAVLQVRIVKAAEADAEAKYLAGQGIARQRQVSKPSEGGRARRAGCGGPRVMG